MQKLSIYHVSSFLKKTTEADLLGLEAQLKMAPTLREKELRLVNSNLPRRLSAILIILFMEDGVLKTLMMKRSSNLNHHAGQISFPGGQVDKDDRSPWETAIRETEEETGIDRNGITFLTKLSDLFIPPSNFNVNVMVGSLKELPKLTPNSEEVDDLIKVPISFFLEEEHIQNMNFEVGEDRMLEAPAYLFNEHIIWGASAMMISELVEILKKMPAE